MPVTLNACLVLVMAILGGCTVMPSGPSVLVLPGSSKTFDEFRGDDLVCRQFAQQQLEGQTPNQIAANSGVSSAIVGTLLGAAAGAAFDGGRGSAAGAGAGLALGGLVGSGTAYSASYGAQQRYDFGYQQCMYAKGHRVPVAARFTSSPYPSPYPPPVMPAR
ncbi:MAG: Proline-rich region [Noviherbaspirillum sp.]|jgi:hypothetical protein|nr:Proline-rich region [Noviherbaspirillum sp.]